MSVAAYPYDFGRPATPEEIKVWDIDIRPDGAGLPEGSGTGERGMAIYEENCAACHGSNGQGGVKDRLVGGIGTLASDNPVKTVGSYWPHATTLFDYVRRAMPYPAPGTLSDDDTYALVAYMLSVNGIVSMDTNWTKGTCQRSKCLIGMGSYLSLSSDRSKTPGSKHSALKRCQHGPARLMFATWTRRVI
jgi:cytochrome c